MNILITGGSGFLGNALTDELLKNPNNHIFWVSRKSFTPNKKVVVLTYEDLNPDLTIDIIINLAGAGIADKRWSAKRKIKLIDSRIKPTEKIIDFIKDSPQKPKLFISGSAIGFYGAYTSDKENPVLDEQSETYNDFQHKLCLLWEKLAIFASYYGTPTAIIRTGVVLDKTGKGMLKKILPQFQFGLGGKLGNGRQTMSWISIDDWVQAVIFIIHKNLSNELSNRQIYNLTAPNPVNNQTFSKALGKFLNRPTLFFVPAFTLRLMLGEMATLLLDGQRVYPKALLEMGFEFKHNKIDEYFSKS